MRHLRPLIVSALALALAGCATLELVPADKAASVGNGISVMPQRSWNKIAKNPDTWTTQGPQIDRVRFFAGIKPGHALMEIPGMKPEQVGLFDAKMLPNDIQDLVVATLQKEGDKTIQAGNLAPCNFGAGKGFCFDLTFVSPADLEMKGLAMARKQSDRLDLILFQAPAEYYFGQMSPDVQKVFASVQAK
jgi:hypothetical protein